jgi:hypothetical protein
LHQQQLNYWLLRAVVEVVVGIMEVAVVLVDCELLHHILSHQALVLVSQ